eukprot:symbB.v1.2.012453.t1/scaffold858.1/size157433/1
MADSDDDMPPLEYVGNVPPVTTSTPDDGDDDMPPLEYVGADASLGISLREGDRVILKGLSKTVLNGQTGTLQSFQKASKGRLPVKLDKSGSMLAVKPENIEKLAMAKSTGIPNHGVAVAKARNVDRNATDGGLDEEDELPPLEPAGCGEDDELPPLEYVGAVGPVANSEQHAGFNEAIAADGDDADDMPNLEYFGASGPSQSNCNGPSAEARATGGGASLDHTNVESSSSSTFRQGDQVLIKGTAKPELDGQQGTIESIKDSNYQVKLEKTGKLLQLAPTNLHKIWLRGSGAGAMPPLQFVGQANGCSPMYSAAPNGHCKDADKADTQKAEPADRGRHFVTPGGSDKSRQPGNPQEVQDTMEMMRSALHATSLSEVDAALSQAQKSPGVSCDEKNEALKQLETKRSQMAKLQQEVSAPSTKSTIEKWCQDLQLPQQLLARLNDEDVTDPEELTGVSEKELAELTTGLKIGPKGRFLKAVKRMKALEAAELGSAVSIS